MPPSAAAGLDAHAPAVVLGPSPSPTPSPSVSREASVHIEAGMEAGDARAIYVVEDEEGAADAGEELEFSRPAPPPLSVEKAVFTCLSSPYVPLRGREGEGEGKGGV